LSETGIRSLLIIGVDVVSLATSARRAGYRIYAVDYFGDQDLKTVCNENLSVIKQRSGQSSGYLAEHFDPEALLNLARQLVRKRKIDAALLSSGLDDSSNILFELNDLIPIIGNNPRTMNEVRDKPKFFKQLQRLGIPHPQTALVENLEEAMKASKDIGYPVVVKPASGFGGAGIRKVKNSDELKPILGEASANGQKVLVQEYVSGIPASVSIVSSANLTEALTLNEQLLGLREMGQTKPFGYCGNIVPLNVETTTQILCKRMAKKISAHFNLVGSNGIDLVISKDGFPFIVEVNPRFQATLECVERVLGINIVETHMRACLHGSLPLIKKKSGTFCTRLILHARQRSIVPDLSAVGEVRDIPLPESIIEEGEPVCSFLTEGATRTFALRKARTLAQHVYSLLQS